MSKNERILIVVALAFGLILYVAAIPECGNSETLVRGMFWFDCV